MSFSQGDERHPDVTTCSRTPSETGRKSVPSERAFDILQVGRCVVDPTAAAIAVARWLHAAATVAADVWGGEPEAVVLEADNIGALPHETPTSVLERMADGETPRNVVLNLVAEALEVAGGRIPDLERLVDEIAEPKSERRVWSKSTARASVRSSYRSG